MTGNGTELDLGSLNLVVDATAGSAFAVNIGTDTITINASVLVAGSKFISIRTTGVVSVANGASIGVTYFDSTQDSIINFIEALTAGDTWKVFTLEADRDANINEIGSGNLS